VGRFLAWLRRLFFGSTAGMSAADMLMLVLDLQKSNADWQQIWARLNPDNNAQVQELLIELRGPHMFVPHAGLNVLEDGCRKALAANPNADRLAALRTALFGADRVVR
jgi:hypothetical protein